MEKLHIYLCTLLIGSIIGVSNASNDVREISITATLNGMVQLPCRLSMQDYQDVNVRWFSRKGGWLTSGTKVYKYFGQLDIVKPAPNEWNLRIKRVTLSFEDTYECQTENGTLKSLVKLVIEISPKIDEQQSTAEYVTFSEGSMATLKCVVTGTPEPEIKWYRGTKEIGITGPELRIRNIDRYAADEYLCRASNKNGEAERRISVTVNFDPEVDVIEPEVYAAGGDVAVMSCVVQASPLYDAYWTFGTDVNGARINANWKYLVQVENGENGMPVRFLTLIIRKSILAHKDYGEYTCVAKGENAVAKGTVTLRETKPVATEGEKVINYN